MEIYKPIFIIGSGRSGTTILYNLLSLHPEVCWFSNLTDRWPAFPQLSAFHRIYDTPFFGNKLKKYIPFPQGLRYRIRPGEAEKIWHVYSGFEKGKKSTENDHSSRSEQKLKKTIEMHLRMTGKKRFLIKQTANNQRIRLMQRIFPDAHYIHIIRDGRAVASSLYNVTWWNDVDIWWLGTTPRQWQMAGKDPAALCALQWKMDVIEILKNKTLFDHRYLELRYEDFVQDVHATMDRIVEHCELTPSIEHKRLLPAKLDNMNYKWSKNFTRSQKQIVEKSISDMLVKLGYMAD